MDPFEGGDGVRANINGNKCVMYGIPGNVAGASYTTGNTFTFQTATILMRHVLDGKEFHFRITVSDDAALEVGRRYSVGSGGSSAVISYVSDDVTGEDIPLTGWITFLQVGPEKSTTEARFELSGRTRGREYEVRHGFLRLYTAKGDLL